MGMGRVVYGFRFLRSTPTHHIYCFNRSPKVIEIRRMKRR